jgi:Fur family transcriptional regulator, peroxide stress response regulator
MNNYTDTLREHNLKATPQRLAIADVLYANGHISIESLYEVMIKRFSSISLATIYKNINLMLENSFIQEVKIPNSKSVYELTKSSHSHLVCEVCDHVSDIDIDLKNIIENTSKLNNFQIDKTDLILSGVCKNCQLS